MVGPVVTAVHELFNMKVVPRLLPGALDVIDCIAACAVTQLTISYRGLGPPSNFPYTTDTYNPIGWEYTTVMPWADFTDAGAFEIRFVHGGCVFWTLRPNFLSMGLCQGFLFTTWLMNSLQTHRLQSQPETLNPSHILDSNPWTQKPEFRMGLWVQDLYSL